MSDSSPISVPFIGWFDEPIKSSVNSVFSGINIGVEALDLFKRYRKSHFAAIGELVGSVKILGMSSPVKLVDFYHPTNVSPDIQRRLYEAEWLDSNAKPGRSPVQVRKRIVDGAEFIASHDRVVVLGGPGAGKTTFLRYLALAYSDKQIFESSKLKHSKFPIFISLPHFSKSGKELLDYISEPLSKSTDKNAREFIIRILDRGMAAIMFDSLDEVPNSDRGGVVDAVRTFLATYPKCKAVVSCRTADYRDIFENFNEVELARLSREAVRKIVKSWFGQDHEAALRLIRVIENDRGFLGLTETPLLLSLLCIQFRHDLSLPRRRVEVYKRCIDTLLRDWDSTRGFRRQTAYSNLSDERKERYFEHVAGKFLMDHSSYVMPEGKFFDVSRGFLVKVGVEEGDVQELIAEVESHHGIVERYSAESFCFSHASFHEYFAARDALAQRVELELIRKRIDDESWAGVIEFIAGLHPDPSSVLEFIKQKASLGTLQNYPAIERRARLLHLLYRCLSTGPALEPNTLNNHCDHIVNSVAAFLAAMGQGGVISLCTYGGAGLRHPNVFFKQKRPSLHSALLPFRKLLNEILVNPNSRYADSVEKYVRDMEAVGSVLSLSRLLNLVVPLIHLRPSFVEAQLSVVRPTFEAIPWARTVIDETLKSIAQK